MLSFYLILAIFPLLLFLVSLLGVILQQSGAALHQALEHYLIRVAPASAPGVIDSTLAGIRRGSSGGTLSLSLVFSLWVASSGFAAVIDALNAAYDVKETRPWWKQRLVALGLTFGIVLLLAAALILLGYGDRIPLWLSGRLHFGSAWFAVGWNVLKWLLLLGFLLMAFNVLYIYAPNVERRRWHWLMPGTVLGVGLWLLVSYGFKLYLGFFNTYNLTYGSIAAVIILLLWLYLSGIAMLVGGELNSEIEKWTGRVEPPPAAGQTS